MNSSGIVHCEGEQVLENTIWPGLAGCVESTVIGVAHVTNSGICQIHIEGESGIFRNISDFGQLGNRINSGICERRIEWQENEQAWSI